jgi:sulfur carrier protein
MNVTVNGVRTELPDGGRTPSARGVAIAVNGEVVPRPEWPSRSLVDGDTVELLVAVQGG